MFSVPKTRRQTIPQILVLDEQKEGKKERQRRLREWLGKDAEAPQRRALGLIVDYDDSCVRFIFGIGHQGRRAVCTELKLKLAFQHFLIRFDGVNCWSNDPLGIGPPVTLFTFARTFVL